MQCPGHSVDTSYLLDRSSLRKGPRWRSSIDVPLFEGEDTDFTYDQEPLPLS